MTNYINATASSQVHSILGPGTAFNTEVTNVNGNVVIDTRLGNDDVRISQHGFLMTVTVNGVGRIDIDTRKVQSITINGGAGNDHLHVDPNVSFPLTLKGGSGNDHIDGWNVGHNQIYGGNGCDQIHAKATDQVTYGNFMKVIQGGATICVPTSQCADVPPPPQTYPPTQNPASPSNQPQGAPLMTPEEIQEQWNKIVQDSTAKNSLENSKQCQGSSKTEKMKRLLEAALACGNIDLAMLLIAGLETREANELAKGLMEKIQEKQAERRKIGEDLGAEKDSGKAAKLNNEAGAIGTDIGIFQTFLQDVMAQKSEAQQMASNYLKSQRDTAQSIIRNMA